MGEDCTQRNGGGLDGGKVYMVEVVSFQVEDDDDEDEDEDEDEDINSQCRVVILKLLWVVVKRESKVEEPKYFKYRAFLQPGLVR